MKQLMLAVLASAMMLAGQSGEVAEEGHAPPGVAHYGDHTQNENNFLVRRSSLVPGYGVQMWLERGNTIYLVKAVGCLAKCAAFQPGTRMPGVLKHGSIDLSYTDGGKAKVGHYAILKEELLASY